MPSYIHPSISTRIIDEDIVFITSQGLTNLFQAFVSEKGQDRVVKYMTSVSEYLLEYGRPNFAKYGQTAFNITQWIATTGGVYCLRVSPVDSTFANKILGLDISYPDVATNPDTYEIQPFSESLSGAIEHASIDAALTATAPGVGASTFLPYKFLGLTVRGRGLAYTDVATRFTPLETYKDTYQDFIVYELEVITKVLNSEVLVETFYVSFDPDSINATSRESMFITDVVNKYSDFIYCIFDQTSFDMIGEELGVNPSKINYIRPADNYLLEDDGTNTGNLVDIFALSTHASTPLIVTTPTLTLDSEFLVSTYMESGDDGTGNNLADAELLLIEGYNGTTDPTVTDKKAVEIDIILDANYTVSVKAAIATLTTAVRGDCMYMADLGFRPTPTSAIDARVLTGFNSETIAIWGQDFRIFDPYERREIRVTTPYLLASKIPTNDANFNIGRNFVGPRRGTVGGFVGDSMSWWPTEPEKSELYAAQVNYIQREPKTIYLGTQLTSKKQNTPLSNISMARAAFRMLRVAERISDDYRFEYYNEKTFSSLTNSIENELNPWIQNETCRTIGVSISASDYEKSIKLLNVRLIVQFTDIIERIAITFIVKR